MTLCQRDFFSGPRRLPTEIIFSNPLNPYPLQKIAGAQKSPLIPEKQTKDLMHKKPPLILETKYETIQSFDYICSTNSVRRVKENKNRKTKAGEHRAEKFVMEHMKILTIMSSKYSNDIMKKCSL